MDCGVVLLLLLLLLCSGVWSQNSNNTECALSVDDRADVVLLLDGFTSISSEDFSKVREFLQSLVSLFGAVGLDTVQMGLVQNAADPHPEFYLNTHSDVSAIVSAVQTLLYRGGSTDTGTALKYVHKKMYQKNQGARVFTPQVLILLTDESQSSRYRHPVYTFRDYDDLEIFAVGVKHADHAELKYFSHHVYIGEDFDYFSKISKELFKSACISIKRKLGRVYPTSLSVTEVRSRSAQISWEFSSTHVERFSVIWTQTDSDSVRKDRVISKIRPIKLTNLHPQTKYEIKVFSSYYKGKYSLPVTGELTTAEDSVRLLHGPSRCSGSLEVLMDQSWTTVCEEGFSRTEAEVVCRQLDCGSVSDLQGALFTEESPVGRGFTCEGGEEELQDCESFETRCLSATNLTCADDTKLELRPLGCFGIPYLRLNDEWRPVMTVDPKLNRDYASAVCKKLSCGDVYDIDTSKYFSGPIWWLDPQCVTPGSSFRDCLVQDSPLDPDKDWGLNVYCTGPYITSISVSSDGGSESHQQVLVFEDSDVRVTCSVKGHANDHFHLMTPTGNYTLPAVNKSAHFLLSGFNHTHTGNYTCAYEYEAIYTNLFMSETLYITVGVSDEELIIRAGIIFLILMISTIALYFYFKASRGHLQKQK